MSSSECDTPQGTPTRCKKVSGVTVYNCIYCTKWVNGAGIDNHIRWCKYRENDSTESLGSSSSVYSTVASYVAPSGIFKGAYVATMGLFVYSLY